MAFRANGVLWIQRQQDSASSGAGAGEYLAAGRSRTRHYRRYQTWLVAGKRDANRNAVILARINQVVGGNGQIVHEGIAQQAEHCLAGRKVAVVSELKAVGPVVDCVEDE